MRVIRKGTGVPVNAIMSYKGNTGGGVPPVILNLGRVWK